MMITNFSRDHIEEAKTIARANYEEERQFVPILPEVENMPDLSYFADNGLGVAAFENNKMVGFLCCYEPWDNVFGTTKVKGTFSPIHAHGTVLENRERIYKHLYQAAAEKWVKNGIVSHAVGLYAHDQKAIHGFFTYGFGLRFIDAIRPMEKIDYVSSADYSYCELEANQKEETLFLKNLLIAHLGHSPMFMSYPQMDSIDLQSQYNRRQPRYFAAYKGEKIIAWVEIMNNGENFACDDIKMQSICGAYCLPEYRGMGVFQNLLNHVINTLKKEGYERLGVDFESFNPTAYGFWLKYFTAYTNSIVRRIDERILEGNA